MSSGSGAGLSRWFSLGELDQSVFSSVFKYYLNARLYARRGRRYWSRVLLCVAAYTATTLLMEFSPIHPRFEAAATAFLDEECFRENFGPWVLEQGLRGDEAHEAMLNPSVELVSLIGCGTENVVKMVFQRPPQLNPTTAPHRVVEQRQTLYTIRGRTRSLTFRR